MTFQEREAIRSSSPAFSKSSQMFEFKKNPVKNKKKGKFKS